MTKGLKPVANQLQLMSESPRQEADSPSGAAAKEVSECPTCGRTDFASEQGMMSHHAKAHNESLTVREYTCDQCGEDFERSYHEGRGDGDYCSPECSAKSRRVVNISRRKLKRLYIYEGKSDEQIAEELGVQRENIHNARKRYDIEGVKSYETPELHMPRYLEYVYHELEMSLSEISDVIDCASNGVGKAMKRYGIPRRTVSEATSKELHYDWKGGVPGAREYGPSWKNKRQEVLERDNRTCRACGLSHEGHKEEYGRDLEVHHIVPVRKFDDPEDAHTLDNLVTACVSCHRKYEGLPVFPERKD